MTCEWNETRMKVTRDTLPCVVTKEQLHFKISLELWKWFSLGRGLNTTNMSIRFQHKSIFSQKILTSLIWIDRSRFQFSRNHTIIVGHYPWYHIFYELSGKMPIINTSSISWKQNPIRLQNSLANFITNFGVKKYTGVDTLSAEHLSSLHTRMFLQRKCSEQLAFYFLLLRSMK